MDRVKNPKTSYAMSRHWLVGIHDCVGTYQYSQKCLQRSATGNNKSGLCWQVAFVQNIRNYFLIFTWRIKTGLCRQETLTCRCPYTQVWLYKVWWIKCARIRLSQVYNYTNYLSQADSIWYWHRQFFSWVPFTTRYCTTIMLILNLWN